MTGYIYIHTNKINGKKYIGQTIQRPERRWGNGRAYYRQWKFYAAIKKYGWDNFEHEVIPAFPEELDFLEREFIKKYDSFKNGYNASLGGDTPSEKCRLACIKHNTGNHSGSYGKKFGPLSDDHKQKIILNRKGKTACKRVLCIETNIIYNSGIDAAKAIGLSKGCHILAAAEGKEKTAGGYHWRYIE